MSPFPMRLVTHRKHGKLFQVSIGLNRWAGFHISCTNCLALWALVKGNCAWIPGQAWRGLGGVCMFVTCQERMGCDFASHAWTCACVANINIFLLTNTNMGFAPTGIRTQALWTKWWYVWKIWIWKHPGLNPVPLVCEAATLPLCYCNLLLELPKNVLAFQRIKRTCNFFFSHVMWNCPLTLLHVKIVITSLILVRF